MLDLQDHVARADLLVGQRLGDRVHRSARHAAAQPRQPRLGRALGEARLEDRPPGRPCARGDRRRWRSGRHAPSSGSSSASTQRLPELRLVAEDDDPAVARGEVLRRHQRLVAGVGDAVRLPGRFSVQMAKYESMLTAVSSSETSMSRPTPLRCASHSPASSARHRDVAAREVHDRDAALPRRPVRLAGDRHPAGVALDQVVERRLGGPRAGGPEAGERAADDGRIDRRGARRRSGRAWPAGRRAGCCRRRGRRARGRAGPPGRRDA